MGSSVFTCGARGTLTNTLPSRRWWRALGVNEYYLPPGRLTAQAGGCYLQRVEILVCLEPMNRAGPGEGTMQHILARRTFAFLAAVTAALVAVSTAHAQRLSLEQLNKTRTNAFTRIS